MPLRLDARRLLAYAAIYILWGATFLAVRTVVLVTPPFSAAAVRFFLSGILLLAISRFQKEPWPSVADWKNSAKLGFVMFAIDYACLFWAEQRIYSGLAAVISATIPVWIFLAEWLIARTQRFSFGMAAGTTLGITGVVLLTRNSAGTGSAAAHAQSHLAVVVLLGGCIAWAAGSVWSRSLKLPAQQSVRSALQMTTGGIFLGVIALIAGEGRQIPHVLLHWTVTTWLCFLYLIVASIVAFTSYVWLLHREPAGRVATYAYVNPLIAMVLGVALGHEHFGLWQVMGAGLVLLGVFATLTTREQKAGG
jgi:drug/metabolite transporter (DMT)-like permease